MTVFDSWISKLIISVFESFNVYLELIYNGEHVDVLWDKVIDIMNVFSTVLQFNIFLHV